MEVLKSIMIVVPFVLIVLLMAWVCIKELQHRLVKRLLLMSVVLVGMILLVVAGLKGLQTPNNSQTTKNSEKLDLLLKLDLKAATSEEFVTLFQELRDSDENLTKMLQTEGLFGLSSFTLDCDVMHANELSLSFEKDPNSYHRSLFREGWIQGALKRAILVKLFYAGLPIAPVREWNHTTTKPILQVDVHITADPCSVSQDKNPNELGIDKWDVVAKVRLLDKFALVRRSNLTFYLPMWECSTLKHRVEEKQLGPIATKLCKALVDEFINDYFAANPKTKNEGQK